MPTGYTEAVKDGISFNTFALTCARAMGALIDMRDAPSSASIPEKFEPSDYHSKELEETQKRLVELQNMSEEERTNAADAEYEHSLASHRAYISEKIELRVKYESMLAQVNDWLPPTEEHIGFKGFMQKQLRDSIDFDCDVSFYTEPKLLSGPEWHEKELTSAMHDINYHTKKYAEEVDRVASRTEWVSQLRKSLGV